MIYNIQNFITDFYSLRSECESKIQIIFPTFGGNACVNFHFLETMQKNVRN